MFGLRRMQAKQQVNLDTKRLLETDLFRHKNQSIAARLVKKLLKLLTKENKCLAFHFT